MVVTPGATTVTYTFDRVFKTVATVGSLDEVATEAIVPPVKVYDNGPELLG